MATVRDPALVVFNDCTCVLSHDGPLVFPREEHHRTRLSVSRLLRLSQRSCKQSLTLFPRSRSPQTRRGPVEAPPRPPRTHPSYPGGESLTDQRWSPEAWQVLIRKPIWCRVSSGAAETPSFQVVCEWDELLSRVYYSVWSDTHAYLDTKIQSNIIEINK